MNHLPLLDTKVDTKTAVGILEFQSRLEETRLRLDTLLKQQPEVKYASWQLLLTNVSQLKAGSRVYIPVNDLEGKDFQCLRLIPDVVVDVDGTGEERIVLLKRHPSIILIRLHHMKKFEDLPLIPEMNGNTEVTKQLVKVCVPHKRLLLVMEHGDRCVL